MTTTLTGELAVRHAFKTERDLLGPDGPIHRYAAREALDAGADPTRYSIVVQESADPMATLERVIAAGEIVRLYRDERLHSARTHGEPIMLELYREGETEPTWRTTGVTIGHAVLALEGELARHPS